MFKIISDFNPSVEANQLLTNALARFNEKILGEAVKPFTVFLKNESGKIQGGAVTYIHSDSIHIDTIWVDEDIRMNGYGSTLLQTAEDEAKRMGCIYSTVSTMDFQAEKFYIRHGYYRVCEFKNYILSHSRIFLRKNLIKG